MYNTTITIATTAHKTIASGSFLFLRGAFLVALLLRDLWEFIAQRIGSFLFKRFSI
jgi:hypothetical protein